MKTLIMPLGDASRLAHKTTDRSKCLFQMASLRASGGGSGDQGGLLAGASASVMITAREVSRKINQDLDISSRRGNGILGQNKGLLMLACSGALMVAFSSIIFCTNPLQLITKMRLSLSEDSFLFDIFRKPPVEVYVKMFVFVALNHEEFLAGREILRVKELGPFTYREVLVNANATFNNNRTVTYQPKRQVFFRPDLSTDIPLDTRIMVPNVPYIGFTAMLADSSMFSNLALLTLARFHNAQPFLNITVHEYLWGYDDPLVRLASSFAPNWISFPQFGLMDRMFDDGDNLVTMNVYDKREYSKTGRVINPVTIDQYNGSPGLEHWGYDDEDNTTHKFCNTLQGLATEGVVFHKHIHPNDTFLIYRKAFCRTIQLKFEKANVTESGFPVFWYKIPDNVFNNSLPENSCYQKPKKPPLPYGLSDVTPCYYKFPAAVSQPHFFRADPVLLSKVIGLTPNQQDHATYVAIQPDIGVPMEVHSRMQTNLVIGHTKYNAKIKPFNNMTIPLFWADLTMAELPADLLSQMHLLLIKGPIIQTGAMLFLAVVGSIVLLVALVNYWKAVKISIGTKDNYHNGNYTPVTVAYPTS